MQKRYTLECGGAAYPAPRRRRRRFNPFLFVILIGLLLAVLAVLGLTRLIGAVGPAPEDSPAPSGSAAPAGYTTLQMEQADMGKGDLVLVNKAHPISQWPQITLTQLMNGQAIDSYCYPQLQQMMDDCRAAGLDPMICSSYRSQETQETLFSEKVSSYLTQGYDRDTAQALARRTVAVPGTSEHQLGRTVDICSLENQNLDGSQVESPVQQWLTSHCADYGFILRYVLNKGELTGIIFEPWHYRYVGAPHARYITDNDLCLEEYIELLKNYPYDGAHLNLDCPEGSFEAYYCEGLEIHVPESGSYTVSGNNEDGFIVTMEGHAAAPGATPSASPSMDPTVPSDGSAVAPPAISDPT